MVFTASWSRCGKWINLWIMQQMLKSCKSRSFRTPNSRYRLFIGVVMFLNCKILKILFCVMISGCMNFLVVFMDCNSGQN